MEGPRLNEEDKLTKTIYTEMNVGRFIFDRNQKNRSNVLFDWDSVERRCTKKH